MFLGKCLGFLPFQMWCTCVVVSLCSFDISLVLFVLLACKSCWFLLVVLVLVVKCSVYLVVLWGWGLA